MSVWSVLPSLPTISYTSVSDAGNTTFVLASLIVSPRRRDEAHPSFGKYKRWVTTFKIDPAVWLAAAGADTFPKPRDTLVVDGLTWTVYEEVDSPAPIIGGIKGLWRIPCCRLEIDAALGDSITLQYPLNTVNDGFKEVGRSPLPPAIGVGGNPTINTLSVAGNYRQAGVRNGQSRYEGPVFGVILYYDGTTWRAAVAGNPALSGWKNNSADINGGTWVIDVASGGGFTAAGLPQIAVTETLACAIQPISPRIDEPAEFQGKHGFRQRFDIFLALPIIPQYGMLVEDQNSVVYEVKGWRNQNRIDELMVLEAVMQP